MKHSRNLFSLTPDNLKIFCKNQVQNRMGPIIGSIDDPSSKFVKELYVQRQDLQSAFNNFINSDKSTFGMVGSAGSGKTSAMCSLALQSLEDNFVFFYNAAIIGKSPLEHIAQDLNGVFSSKSESSNILKKLDELGKFIDKSVIIFIDAIDECVIPYISLELSELALASRNLEKVKICISCKLNIWKNFLRVNDTNTHLYEELFTFHGANGKLESNPGFLLEDFSDKEIKDIIPLYKKTFGFKGEISESLSIELRNGFFLRIFSEVYSNKEIPQKIKDKDLISKYINQSLKKTNIDPRSSLRILSKIGKILINHKYDSWNAFKNEGLEVDNLLDKLNLSDDENLPEDLFNRNILIKSNKDDSYNISFYYSKIRDYIICFHSYKLDTLSDDEFYNVLIELYQNYIGQSAIAFYIENASISHKSVLIKFKKERSLNYVTEYNSYLNHHFKKFKEKFDPYTNGEIGIIIPKDILKSDGYALIPIENLSDQIQFESFDKAISGSYYEDPLFQKGAHTVHMGNSSLMILDQSKLIQKNIFNQLKEIIEKGQFSANNSEILMMEKVSTILYYYFNKLGYDYNLNDYFLPRYNLIYPIDLKDLKNRIYKFRANHFYKRKNIAPNLINELVEKALKENIIIPKLNHTGDFPPFEELFEIVNILLNNGHTVFESHHLPCPDILIVESKAINIKKGNHNISLIRSSQFSKEHAKLYIEKFFYHLESCYKEFVEYCFPTLKDELPFYTTLPHEYNFYINDTNDFIQGMMGYRPSKNGKLKVVFKKHKPHNKIFEEDQITSLRGFSLNNILYNDSFHQIKTIDKINTPEVDDFCVIRNWVYKLLENDMEKIFKEKEDLI